MGTSGSARVAPSPHATIENSRLNQLESTIVTTIQNEVNKAFASPASLHLIKKAVSDAMEEHRSQKPTRTEVVITNFDLL